MLEAITSSLTVVLSWAGTVVDSIVTETGDLHALLPLFAIGIAVSACMLGVKIVKSFVWGA